MEINKIYTDFWELLGWYLSSDDLYNFAITCKQAWKACKRYSIRKKMSHPMSFPWRLTYEQRTLVQKMERGSTIVKVIHGNVGAGKTITSISYAIRNYEDGKVVMCGPPSLIKMWWETLRKYFKIEPYVLHGTNPKYSPQNSWEECPKEKFILTSYLLLGRRNPDWFDNTRDLLILDEAHHYVSVNFYKFKETIALTATATDKSEISRGVKGILRRFDLKMEDCIYPLQKTIIARKLPPIKYYPYMVGSSDINNIKTMKLIRYKKEGEQDLSCVSEICKLISHPIISDLESYFTPGYIMIGRKSFRVPLGNMDKYNASARQLRADNPLLNHREIRKSLINHATYDILKMGKNYPKYIKAYQIVKWANDKGEKVLLFDQSIKYLPFLHKFLIGCGINSYIFSTHYDAIGRQKQLFKFKEDKNPGVLLSSIAMLGEGQNVTEANHIIFFTQCMKHTKYYQAIGRCWRYPQSKTVNVHLLFGNLFDRKVYEHACGAINIEELKWVDLLMKP